jgi:hypothetical protein
MNDHHLADWLTDVLRTLEGRRVQEKNAARNYGEIEWYIDAVKACVTRIRLLESEAADKLQMRDKIALQILPSLSGHDDIGMAIGESLRIADLYIEARKEPSSKTIQSVRP